MLQSHIPVSKQVWIHKKMSHHHHHHSVTSSSSSSSPSSSSQCIFRIFQQIWWKSFTKTQQCKSIQKLLQSRKVNAKVHFSVLPSNSEKSLSFSNWEIQNSHIFTLFYTSLFSFATFYGVKANSLTLKKKKIIFPLKSFHLVPEASREWRWMFA